MCPVSPCTKSKSVPISFFGKVSGLTLQLPKQAPSPLPSGRSGAGSMSGSKKFRSAQNDFQSRREADKITFSLPGAPNLPFNPTPHWDKLRTNFFIHSNHAPNATVFFTVQQKGQRSTPFNPSHHHHAKTWDTTASRRRVSGR